MKPLNLRQIIVAGIVFILGMATATVIAFVTMSPGSHEPQMVEDQHSVENSVERSGSIKQDQDNAETKQTDKRIETEQDSIENAVEVSRPLRLGQSKEIDRWSFTYQGVSGYIIHYCVFVQVFVEDNEEGEERCFGTNTLVAEWNGTTTIIEVSQTDTIEDLFSVHSVSFNEGQYEKAKSRGVSGNHYSTSSTKEATKLLIAIDTLHCLGQLPDLCWANNELSYAINLPELTVNKVNISQAEEGRESRAINLGFLNMGKLTWNDVGTKALVFPPSPAGCPGSTYDLLDLDKQTIQSYKIEPEGCGPPPAVWLDDNTFQSGSTTVKVE